MSESVLIWAAGLLQTALLAISGFLVMELRAVRIAAEVLGTRVQDHRLEDEKSFLQIAHELDRVRDRLERVEVLKAKE